MQLVHATGVTTADSITDGHYQRENVYYIRADVEMYQKIERKKKRKDKDGKTHTSYHYHDTWRSSFVDSSHFHRHRGCNPHFQWPHKSMTKRPD